MDGLHSTQKLVAQYDMLALVVCSTRVFHTHTGETHKVLAWKLSVKLRSLQLIPINTLQ